MNSNQIFTEVRRLAPHVHLMGAQVRAGFVDVTTMAQSLGEAYLMRGVMLQVEPTSTERLWIVRSFADGVGDGLSIDGGDRHFFLPVGNLNQIWLVAESNVRVQFWAI